MSSAAFFAFNISFSYTLLYLILNTKTKIVMSSPITSILLPIIIFLYFLTTSIGSLIIFDPNGKSDFLIPNFLNAL